MLDYLRLYEPLVCKHDLRELRMQATRSMGVRPLRAFADGKFIDRHRDAQPGRVDLCVSNVERRRPGLSEAGRGLRRSAAIGIV